MSNELQKLRAEEVHIETEMCERKNCNHVCLVQEVDAHIAALKSQHAEEIVTVSAASQKLHRRAQAAESKVTELESQLAISRANNGILKRSLEARQAEADSAVARVNDEFKNFHRLLCDRFGYVHDEIDWRRDQISLIEHVAKVAAENERLKSQHIAQPISTAPKSGKPILLFVSVKGFGGKDASHWSTGSYSCDPCFIDGKLMGCEEGFTCDADECIPLNQQVFTHWMPLPAATWVDALESSK